MASAAERRSDEETGGAQQPLLTNGEAVSSEDAGGGGGGGPTSALAQAVMGQTFKSVADLAKRLPTGTVLAFQVLSPLVTNVGRCASADRAMTACLLLVCALSCVVLSFTDSVKGRDGTLRYGVATRRGLLIIDGGGPLPPGVDPARYKMSAGDFVHAFTTLVVFLAVALFDKNVVSCFYPVESTDARRVMALLPVVLGVAGSALVVTFPSSRHGIGFPVAAPTSRQ